MECLAYIDVTKSEFNRAARLPGAAGAARERLDALSEDTREISELAEAMGEQERDRAMAEGSLIDLDSAVEIALDEESWI